MGDHVGHVVPRTLVLWCGSVLVMEELLTRPAVELAGLVRTGQVSARELVGASLARVEAVDPVVGAFASTCGDRALDDAARVTAGDPRPFAGVPLALKDSAAEAGVPCPIGSRLFARHRPTEDSAAVRRLREAGFIVVGRTKMPELGILPTTEPRSGGPARNPFDLSRTHGGSSGGAAAALAAGTVPVAHGGDGGGSLRIPAACCGLVALKPSRGRVSSAPAAGDDPLVTQGALTRTVADAAALLDVLAGYEPGDATWAPPPPRPYQQVTREALQHPPVGLRVGVVLAPPVPAGTSTQLHPECARVTADTAHLLEELGHHVEQAVLPVVDEDTWRAFDDVWAVLAGEGVAAGAALLGRPVTADDVEPLTWALYEHARSLGALAHRSAHGALQRLARDVVTATTGCDVLLTPALATPPVPLGTITGSLIPDPREALVLADRFSPYTALWNLTGQPAIALPAGNTADGLPLGVQLVGRPTGEGALLALSTQLEHARPWAHPPPPRLPASARP